MSSTCLECDNPATKKCAQCHVAEYCSAECQKAHWVESHHLVCFSIVNPDLKKVNNLLHMTYEDEDAKALQDIAHEHQDNKDVMYGIAGMIQMAYDGEHELEEIGDKYDRRARRKAKRANKWRRRKHSVLRNIPGTRSYRARKLMRDPGYAYGPAPDVNRSGYKRTVEDFEAERRGYY